MKKNTQKLLLSLYSPIDRSEDGVVSSNGVSPSNRIKLANLDAVIPGLTQGGKRSLLHVLKKKGLINSERALGVTSIGITQYGIDALEVQFPALSSRWDMWQGSWDCLIFVKALRSDAQFRYLRSLLISEGAISISRGVYISPFSFSDKVVRECKETYRNNILMFSVGDWKIASLRTLIVEKYGLLDFIESYSGISKDVSRLLISVDTHSGLIHRHKIEISLVYDRLRELLSEDPGFCRYYFKEMPKVRSILSKFNSIISR